MTETVNRINELVTKWGSKHLNYGMPQTEALDAILDALERMEARILELETKPIHSDTQISGHPV